MIAATAARPKKPSDSAGSADLICSAMPEVENEVLGVESRMTVRMRGRKLARATPNRTAAEATAKTSGSPFISIPSHAGTVNYAS